MKMPELSLPEGIVPVFTDSAQECATTLARDVAQWLRSRLERASKVTLVVSGGSTPVPFFHALAQESLAWSKVSVLLADERWVPEGDPASNTSLVRENLLQGPASAARFLSLKQPLCTAEQALPAIERMLSEERLPLDVVVLGMGNDGHTASLFPDAPELERAMAPEASGRAWVMTPPSQDHTRVTLTGRVLGGARFLALHLKGEDKLETLRRALLAPEDWREMPIRAFLKPGLRIYWSP